MVIKPEELHRRSIRLPGYDYSQPGAYFVTLVTHRRVCLFGEVVGEEMRLSQIGEMVHREWLRLPKRFPMVELEEFVVMPNHLHAILVIRGRGTGFDFQDRVRSIKPRAPTSERYGAPVSGSIPTLIRSFKSSTTLRYRWIGGNDPHPLWQRNYFEHVIRNEADWDRIHRYILANPLLWPTDEENR